MRRRGRRRGPGAPGAVATSGALTSRLLPYSGRPAQPRMRLVPAFARRPEQPVLLERVDDLLEADEVRLEGRHVREQQRQALLPAVGEVADVERRDEARRSTEVRRAVAWRRRAAGPSGSVNVNVDPSPSSDSTPIVPPWPWTTCRAIDRPRPVPPPRTRARSAL